MALTSEQQAIVLNQIGKPLLNATLNIGFRERYEELLITYPKIDAYFMNSDYEIAQDIRLEIVMETSIKAGFPLRYQNSRRKYGGWWEENRKKLSRKDIILRFEMEQWIQLRFDICPSRHHRMLGGNFQKLLNAIRVEAGEDLDFQEDVLTPLALWCYSENDLYKALTDNFNILNDLLEQLPEGKIDGWPLK